MKKLVDTSDSCKPKQKQEQGQKETMGTVTEGRTMSDEIL